MGDKLCISETDLSELAADLCRNTTITDLELSGCYLDTPTVEMLAHHPSIRSLSIHNSDLEDDDVMLWGWNTTLKSLKLRENRITKNGVWALARNTCLTALDLDSNAIGDDGVLTLCMSTSITDLGVSNNGLTDSSIHSLVRMNSTVTALDITYNGITNEGLNLLATKPTLVKIAISLPEIWNPPLGLCISSSITDLTLIQRAVEPWMLEYLGSFSCMPNLLNYDGPRNDKIEGKVRENRERAALLKTFLGLLAKASCQ